eukprot:4006466-Heterocapsa_arctica.AAC.1
MVVRPVLHEVEEEQVFLEFVGGAALFPSSGAVWLFIDAHFRVNSCVSGCYTDELALAVAHHS